MSRFGARPETPKRLFDEAWAELRSRAPRWDGKADEAWVGTVGFGGHQPGNSAALFLQGTPSLGAPAHRVENACASSGFAIRDAFLAVRSGAVDVAVAAGVESMTPYSKAHRGYWLGVSGDTEVERASGLTFPGVYALMARAHMERFGTTKAHLAAVAVENHAPRRHAPHPRQRGSGARAPAPPPTRCPGTPARSSPAWPPRATRRPPRSPWQAAPS